MSFFICAFYCTLSSAAKLAALDIELNLDISGSHSLPEKQTEEEQTQRGTEMVLLETKMGRYEKEWEYTR